MAAELEEFRPSQPRSRRIYVLWGLALALLLGLGTFCWLVVTPVWRVRSVVEQIRYDSDFQRAAARLGNSQEGLAAIRLYLKMPEWVAPLKRMAVGVAREYGKESLGLLIEALEHDNASVRHSAVMYLGTLGRDAAPAELHLECMLLDESSAVREVTSIALEQIRVAKERGRK